MNKCLFLHGSPRIEGNSDKVLLKLKEALDNYSIECNHIYLQKLDISPCRGCDICNKNSSCIYNDDFTNLIDLLVNSNIIVIGTPVYFGGVTSFLKLFIDRLQFFYNNHSMIKEKKTLFFISVAAEHNPKVFEPLILSLKYICYALNIDFVEKILINGYYEITDVNKLLTNYDLEQIVDNIMKVKIL